MIVVIGVKLQWNVETFEVFKTRPTSMAMEVWTASQLLAWVNALVVTEHTHTHTHTQTHTDKQHTHTQTTHSHTHTNTPTKTTKVIFGKMIWVIHVAALLLQHFSWTQSTAMLPTASETWVHINVAIKHFWSKCTAVWWLWENVFSLSPIVGFALGMTCNNYVRLKCTWAGLVFACY